MTLDATERYLRGHDLWKFRELVAKAVREKRRQDADTLVRLQAILDADKRRPMSDRHYLGE